MALTQELNRCIESCTVCEMECRDCARVCYEMPGMPGMEACASACEECAVACDTCISTMQGGSNGYCANCAEVCDRCAQECANFEHDFTQRCAQVCRDCAEECRLSAATPAFE